MDPAKLDRKNLRELLELSDSFDWDERSDTSEWSGISLDNEDRILGLNVANRNLSGELPAALGEISNLEYIHAASNLFTGGGIEDVRRKGCALISLASVMRDTFLVPEAGTSMFSITGESYVCI